MTECANCKDLIIEGDCVKCYAGCGKVYHFSCNSVSASTWKGMAKARKEAWKCKDCKPGRWPINVEHLSRPRSSSLVSDSQPGLLDASELSQILGNTAAGGVANAIKKFNNGSLSDNSNVRQREEDEDGEEEERRNKKSKSSETEQVGGINEEISNEDLKNGFQKLLKMQSVNEERFSKLLGIINKNNDELSKNTSLLVTLEKKFDDNNTLLTKLQTELRIKDDKIIDLEKKLKKLIEENSLISQKYIDRLNEMDQYSRNFNFELHNVPEMRNENLEELVMEIGQRINVEIGDINIEAVHRIPSKNQYWPRPIIVQLSSRKLRDKIIANKKQKILQNEIIRNGSRDRIYINENLTPFYKELFYKAKEVSRNYKFAFCWFKDRKIFIKLTENGKAHWIRNYKDIDDLIDKVKDSETSRMETDEAILENERRNVNSAQGDLQNQFLR